jgi:hypothetical protein
MNEKKYKCDVCVKHTQPIIHYGFTRKISQKTINLTLIWNNKPNATFE